MLILQASLLILVALTATGVALTRDPVQQIIGMSAYGLVLAAMFFALQAPDVALSQLVIGAVALPLMVLITLAKIRKDKEEYETKRSSGKKRPAP